MMDQEFSDEDMAAVGRALMHAISAHAYPGWSPADCPSEIVGDLRNECDELRAKLMKWLPIETAPKSKDLLLLLPRGRVVVGRWNRDALARVPKPYWSNDRVHIFGIRETRKDQPTHWMPIPQPPKSED